MKENLRLLLSGELPRTVYCFTSRASAPTVARLAARRGWHMYHLDGRRIASKQEFLRACAEAMALPSYFGHNWDALEECLADLPSAPPLGYLVLYDAAGRFAAASPEEFSVALDVMCDAAARRREGGAPMAFLLRGAGRAMRGLARLSSSR